MAKENTAVQEPVLDNNEENCKCAPAACKCEKIAHCAYHVAKILLKAATVCAICHVAKEVHKVHKAIERKSRPLL